MSLCISFVFCTYYIIHDLHIWIQRILLILTILLRYGIEQEYTLLQTDVKWPLGWPVGGYPGPQVVILFATSH